MQLNYIFIGKMIREFRRRKNLTQETLAERVDLSVTYICMIETGRKHISLKKIAQIADALDVTVDKLIYESRHNCKSDYRTIFIEIMSDCSNYELQVFLDTITSLKKSMRENIDTMLNADF